MTRYRAKPGTPPILKILARMSVTPKGCWEWLGASIKDGYGMVDTPAGAKLVHRVSYEHFVGPIPKGLLVRHKCDNPPCFYPPHLELGTDKDNAQDMVKRGRWRCGPGRFTRDQVKDIRLRHELGERQVDIGKEYGVSQNMISRIVRGSSYGFETAFLDGGEADLETEGGATE